MKKLLAVLMVALGATVVIAAECADITIPELKAAIAAKTVTLLDANGTESWQAGHIPGAVDFTTQKDKLAELLPADKSALVVAYCGGPQCMAYKAAAKAAVKLGYTNVKHLSAGIHGWKDAGEAVEKGL
jgi:rhodanese-related sulfurtransferase